MTPEQIAKLKALAGDVLDVALFEADPDNWPGAGKPPEALDAKDRGNRNWHIKNAAATVALAERMSRMAREAEAEGGGGPRADEPSLEDEVAAAEREAEKRVKGMLAKVGKAGARGSVEGKR